MMTEELWVSGIVAMHNGQPYVELAGPDGVICWLTLAQARQIAMDMLITESRTELHPIG